jgi:hypothetical protein
MEFNITVGKKQREDEVSRNTDLYGENQTDNDFLKGFGRSHS